MYSFEMELENLVSEVKAFVNEREWQKFHTPENLAKSISIESSELLELFQWSSDVSKEELADELADVLTYCLLLADASSLEIISIVREKLAKTRLKYPVEKSKGKSDKYDRL